MPGTHTLAHAHALSHAHIDKSLVLTCASVVNAEIMILMMVITITTTIIMIILLLCCKCSIRVVHAAIMMILCPPT